jgi:oligoribonuclease
VNDRLVWIDCEMTGLDVDRDVLLEVAAVVTDSQLNLLDDGVDVVIAAPEDALAGMIEIVRTMHDTSGLTAAARASSVTLAQAEQQMRDLDAHLHYRIIDVSSVKELVRRWYPKVYYSAPAKRGGHRALADIRESIEELRYYRSTVFVAPPGPDSERAQAAARAIVDPLAPVTGSPAE